MDKFIEGMFDSKTKYDKNYSSDTDKILAESVIYKMAGSYDKLSAIYESAGKYGVRDGLLNECPTFDNPCEKHPHVCAVLAAAKEAGSKDYDVYMNALEVAKLYLERMEKTFGIAAKMKIDNAEKSINDNDMIKDAIDQVNGTAVSDEGCKKC